MESKFRKEFKWVVSILESCQNDFHIQSTKNLFENLISKHKNHIHCKGDDCLYEELIREEFQHYLDIKTKSLFF